MSTILENRRNLQTEESATSETQSAQQENAEIIEDDDLCELVEIIDDKSSKNDEIDIKTQYRNDKKFVKSYLGQKISFGTNSLLIKKISGKFMTIVETQNGIIHEHRRHDMSGTARYIGYKKSILSRTSSNSKTELNLSKQSAGYVQQFNNMIDLQDEIKYLISLMHQESKCKLSHNVEFTNEFVQVNLEDGSIIELFFRYDTEHHKLALSHNVDISNIVCQESLQLITFIQKLSTLIIDNSTKAALEFKHFMQRMYRCRLQLEKLATTTEDFEIDNTLKADIVQYIEKATVGDELIIKLGVHQYNGDSFDRSFVIRKITKVRTIVELIASSENSQSIVEYRSTILKISHNINDNTERLLTLHNALK